MEFDGPLLVEFIEICADAINSDNIDLQGITEQLFNKIILGFEQQYEDEMSNVSLLQFFGFRFRFHFFIVSFSLQFSFAYSKSQLITKRNCW